MEIDDVIHFGDDEYCVVKVLYRSKWSCNQRFVEPLDPNIELRRRFYLVERGGEIYWIKEYTSPDLGHGILYEYNETRKVFGAIGTKRGRISAVDAIALAGNRILFEYLDGYTRLSDLRGKISSGMGSILKELLLKWIEKVDVRNYDMCENNIMVKGDDKILSVKMLDFEYSTGASSNMDAWKRFIKSIKVAK